MIELSDEALREKILGCWIGKNCGGTLGGPLEKCFSEEEPFAVDFYPEIREGGIPNDDLEIQLIWLRMLEEVGLDFTADDFAEYWLDHVHYNFDEYGLTMANLRLGLRPPMAGFYNNYFRDCMGCPIRTEIWACIAPGRPRVAARYALMDSIVDHAGGESLYGSLFNVAVESAAFVVSEPRELIRIGLSYLPEASLTARCIRAAVEGYHAGDDWKAARKRVLKIGRHFNAQFSPPNIAFQVVGWLYGTDFGDAICKAVNCGYDTDCTGATLGSILGILDGAKALPARWTAPLGNSIATSDPDGVKNMYLPPYPAPRTLEELTERTIRIGRKVAERHGAVDLAALDADEEVLRLATESPTRIWARLSTRLHLSLDCAPSPQIRAGKEKEISVTVRNDHPEAVPAEIRVQVPEGWTTKPERIAAVLPPAAAWSGRVVVRAAKRSMLANANPVLFHVQPRQRPALAPQPVVLVGAPVWLRSQRFPGKGKAAADLLDRAFAPEESRGSLHGKEARRGKWTVVEAAGNDVGSCLSGFDEGVIYLRGFLRSPDARQVRLHVCSTIPAKAWLNGSEVLASKVGRILRPAAWGHPVGGLHGDVPFEKGWNELLLKFSADAQSGAFACHVLCSDPARLFAGLVDMTWCRFPWDKAKD